MGVQRYTGNQFDGLFRALCPPEGLVALIQIGPGLSKGSHPSPVCTTPTKGWKEISDL